MRGIPRTRKWPGMDSDRCSIGCRQKSAAGPELDQDKVTVTASAVPP